MEVTPIGWILIPLGVGFFWFAPERLYWWMVFSLPFSATAIVNIGSGDSQSGVQATMFFGTLWMVRTLLKFLGSKTSAIRQNLEAPAKHLRRFAWVAAISLIVPIWINGKIFIDDAEYSNGISNAEPLVFKARHITQLLYLIYGVLLAILVAFENSEIRQFVRSVRIFLISSIFVAIWGYVQFFCSLLGITYPAFIFNTSATKSALGYLEELEDVGIARISSVATEPSIFAGFMLIAFVFALFALLRKKPLISKMWDRLGTGIIFVALLISTSTTAYVGLAFIGTVYLIVIYRLDILHRKHIVGLVWLLVSVVLIVGLIPAAQDIFSTLVVGKSENYSGIARAYSIALAAEYFLQYPILGLGWGSVTSHDLVFKILSNTGVIGLLAFSMFAISLFKRLWRGTAGDADPEWRIWYGCVLAAYLVLLFTNATTGFAFVFEHVWFLFGLAMAVPVLSSAVAVPSYRPPNLGAPKVVAT